MAWQEKSKTRWEFALELQKDRLGKYAQDVDVKLDRDRFDMYLQNLHDRCARSGLGKALSSVAMDRVQDFAVTIGNMCQSNVVACLTWGIVRLMLEVAFAFKSVFREVAEMLSDITSELPMLEKYRNLFPTAHELDETLVQLYTEYVGFCIDTVLFFKKSKWTIFRRLAFGSLKETFQRSKQAIGQHVLRFKTQLDLVEKRQRNMADNHIMTLHPADVDRQATVKGVPFQQNFRFIGRDTVLEKLHQNLLAKPWKENQRLLSCTVHGMGGIGKTQVALEYTFRHRTHYHYIFWLKAETAPELASSFGNLARSLCPDQAGQDQHRNIELVREWFMRNRSWLLVFDNAEVDLTPYWPPSTHGSIMITTQRQNLTHQTTSSIQLETFDEDVGAKTILDTIDPTGANTTPKDRELIKQISNELGGLPLLLSHIAGFIDATKCPLSDLLSNLQEPSSFKKVWAFDSTTSTTFQYGEPMRKVWAFSLKALHQDALETLYILAMLNSDGVSEDLLFDDWSGKDLKFLAPSKTFEFNEIRRSLAERHLVTVSVDGDQRSLSMHRLLKQHLIHLMDEAGKGQLSTVFQRALAVVRKAYPVGHELQEPTNHTWTQCEAALPHVTSLNSIFDKWSTQIVPTLPLATLLADVANYMWERGIVGDGITIMESGEAVCKKLNHLGEIDIVHAHICAIAISVHADLGYSGRQRAYDFAIKGLALREHRVESLEKTGAVQKTDYLNLANAWNDVGVMLIQQHKFANAQPNFDESLRIKRQWATEDALPWHYGETYKNIAFVQLALGKFDEAMTYARKATNLCTRNMPEKCASSMKAHFVEATIALNSRHIHDAQDKHKYILRIRKEIFGDTHQLTRDSIFALGEIYRLRQKWQKAEYVQQNHDVSMTNKLRRSCFRTALKDPEGWPNECIARAKFHLALVLLDDREQNSDARTDEASALNKDAKTIRENVYGPDEEGCTADDLLQRHELLVSLWAGRLGIGPCNQNPTIHSNI